MTNEIDTPGKSGEEKPVKKVTVVRQQPYIDPEVGFVEGNPNNFVAAGDEESILEGMRQRGWSEAALQALKSGKSITRNVTVTPIGRVGHDENWSGKETE
jgi:hypothetical protein